MKGKLFILVALAVFAIPALGSAASPRMGPYVSGFIGVSMPPDTDVNTTSNSGTINDRVEFDPGVNVGASGGFDFGYVRLEGELSYRHSEIATVKERISGGDTFTNTDGSLGVFATMFNGFIDLHNDSPVTPYLGGGIGFATLHLSDTFGTSRTSGDRFQLYESDDDTVFAYQVGGGVEISLNRLLSLDLGYRYFATSRADFDDNLDTTDMKYESHNGTVGIRVKF